MGRRRGSGVGPSAMDNSWRAESDHRTLREAASITEDPARMKGVRKHHVEQTKTLKKMDPMLGDGKIRGTKDYKSLMGSLKQKS